MESGLPNGKERTECERQGQQQPLVEPCRLTARKLGLPQPRKWGKQARQLVECQVPLKRLEWFQMIAICSGAQWSLDGGQRFMVRLRPGRLAQSQSSQCSLCLDADGSFHSPYLLLKHSDYHHGCSLLKSQGPSLFSLTPGPLPILPCTSRMPVNGSNDREDESGQVSWG